MVQYPKLDFVFHRTSDTQFLMNLHQFVGFFLDSNVDHLKTRPKIKTKNSRLDVSNKKKPHIFNYC